MTNEEGIITEEKYDFIQENVEILWKKFIEYISPNAQNSFLNIIMNQMPKIEDNIITVQVSNNINYEIMQLHSSDIVHFFISNTNTNEIELKIEILKKEADVLLIKRKPIDRLKDLIAENDKILYMIQKLKLDLDTY